MTSSSDNMDVFDLQMTPDQRAQGELEIANMGRITMHQFKVVAAVLLGIALASFFGRIFIRLLTQRRLNMDDGFLTVALACLCAGTVIIYEHIQIIYLGFAILQNHTALQIAREQMDNFYDPKWRFAYVFLLWTTVFAVKWCYFAFFFTHFSRLCRIGSASFSTTDSQSVSLSPLGFSPYLGHNWFLVHMLGEFPNRQNAFQSCTFLIPCYF